MWKTNISFDIKCIWSDNLPTQGYLPELYSLQIRSSLS